MSITAQEDWPERKLWNSWKMGNIGAPVHLKYDLFAIHGDVTACFYHPFPFVILQHISIKPVSISYINKSMKSTLGFSFYTYIYWLEKH